MIILLLVTSITLLFTKEFLVFNYELVVIVAFLSLISLAVKEIKISSILAIRLSGLSYRNRMLFVDHKKHEIVYTMLSLRLVSEYTEWVLLDDYLFHHTDDIKYMLFDRERFETKHDLHIASCPSYPPSRILQVTSILLSSNLRPAFWAFFWDLVPVPNIKLIATNCFRPDIELIIVRAIRQLAKADREKEVALARETSLFCSSVKKRLIRKDAQPSSPRPRKERKERKKKT
jgi:hypothetical protein